MFFFPRSWKDVFAPPDESVHYEAYLEDVGAGALQGLVHEFGLFVFLESVSRSKESLGEEEGEECTGAAHPGAPRTWAWRFAFGKRVAFLDSYTACPKSPS